MCGVALNVSVVLHPRRTLNGSQIVLVVDGDEVLFAFSGESDIGWDGDFRVFVIPMPMNLSNSVDAYNWLTSNKVF